MKKYALIVAFFVFIFNGIKAQSIDNPISVHDFERFTSYKYPASVDLTRQLDVTGETSSDIHRDVMGYPFLIKGWGKGHIEMNNDRPTIFCESINLCFYDEKIWFKDEDGIPLILRYSPKIKNIVIDGHLIVFKVIPFNNMKITPVEVLVPGEKINLYRYCSSKFYEARIPETDLGTSRKAEYKNFCQLIYKTENSEIEKIPTNKKEFIKIFPDKNKEISNFLAKQKINLKKEKDVIKVFEYYYTLFEKTN